MRRKFPDDLSSADAMYAAQKLAFGPMMFQAARVLRDSGVLEFIGDRADVGASAEEVSNNIDSMSRYAAEILVEAGLAAGMLQLREDRYVITKVGYFVLRDPMTMVNMDFVHDVCYRPMFYFDLALREGRPVGLKEHGEWATIYRGLSRLPEHVRRSWLAFDHFYSDGVFQRAAPWILKRRPVRILDIGGNTGKFARICCEYDRDVQVQIIDLPGQLAVALDAAKTASLDDRISGEALDMLDPNTPIPSGFDAIWMSQFLDCFSEEEITSILTRAAAAMCEEARLYILETFWDRQEHEAARYALINTSLYFSAVANGNSKMYHSERMVECLHRAGLIVEEEIGGMGYHTLLCCKRAGDELPR